MHAPRARSLRGGSCSTVTDMAILKFLQDAGLQDAQPTDCHVQSLLHSPCNGAFAPREMVQRYVYGACVCEAIELLVGKHGPADALHGSCLRSPHPFGLYELFSPKYLIINLNVRRRWLSDGTPELASCPGVARRAADVTATAAHTPRFALAETTVVPPLPYLHPQEPTFAPLSGHRRHRE